MDPNDKAEWTDQIRGRWRRGAVEGVAWTTQAETSVAQEKEKLGMVHHHKPGTMKSSLVRPRHSPKSWAGEGLRGTKSQEERHGELPACLGDRATYVLRQ